MSKKNSISKPVPLITKKNRLHNSKPFIDKLSKNQIVHAESWFIQKGTGPENAKDPRIGGNVSRTPDPYTITDVKEQLWKYDYGPIRGSNVVNDLNEKGWDVQFWKPKGKAGRCFSGEKLILLPAEKSLIQNAMTLFHEGGHALRGLKGSDKDVWLHFEEEIRTIYDDILFLKGNAKKFPDLIEKSNFAEDWSKIEKMNQAELANYFCDQAPFMALSYMQMSKRHMDAYSEVLNDIDKACDIIRDVFIKKPRIPIPKRTPKRKSLIKKRENWGGKN